MKKRIVPAFIFVLGLVIGIELSTTKQKSYCVSEGNVPNAIRVHRAHEEDVVVKVHYYNQQSDTWSIQEYPVLAENQDLVFVLTCAENTMTLVQEDTSQEVVFGITTTGEQSIRGYNMDGRRSELKDGKEWIMYAVYCSDEEGSGAVMLSSLQTILSEDTENVDFAGDVYAISVQLIEKQ